MGSSLKALSFFSRGRGTVSSRGVRRQTIRCLPLATSQMFRLNLTEQNLDMAWVQVSFLALRLEPCTLCTSRSARDRKGKGLPVKQ